MTRLEESGSRLLAPVRLLRVFPEEFRPSLPGAAGASGQSVGPPGGDGLPGDPGAVNFAALPGIEVEFEDDFDGLYANLTALNRYSGEEWGFNYENRLFTPPFISFADPDGASGLLEDLMKIEVPRVIQTSTGPSMHTSPFRPENDRFWSICNEAGIGRRPTWRR